MIDEKLKEEIVSMWKKGVNVSQISREKGVSRPTVRKIIEEHKVSRKWWIVRNLREDGFARIVVRAPPSSCSIKDGDPVTKLALGVEFYELDGLIREIVKPETADEIMYNIKRDIPGISVLYVRQSELNDNYRHTSN